MIRHFPYTIHLIQYYKQNVVSLPHKNLATFHNILFIVSIFILRFAVDATQRKAYIRKMQLFIFMCCGIVCLGQRKKMYDWLYILCVSFLSLIILNFTQIGGIIWKKKCYKLSNKMRNLNYI